ncbi:YheC/YheD family protein [Candidatus Albibeggiatoa sp. nov. BB20]|uniref:ATP-grasp domain-containing protein n=1 Tax=Candidatus Albibeggiatoa sp. nov. BB20 TaxID=3162723 RepID=UPI0033654B3F
MNSNIQVLNKVCKKLNLDYQLQHLSKNIVEVTIAGKKHLFTSFDTPLNSQSVNKLCRDKDYFYQYFQDTIKMPKTQAYLNPHHEGAYTRYLELNTIMQIMHSIEQNFQYPLIIKQNRGTSGKNVFKAENQQQLEMGLLTIFNKNDMAFDYVALAQELIDIDKEFRVIYLNGQLQFAYEKSNESAQFTGNLSPLHWEGAKAILQTEQNILDAIDLFCQPLFQKLMIPFCGLDVILDKQGQWWLLEANSAPAFHQFIKSGYEHKVMEFYENLLASL